MREANRDLGPWAWLLGWVVVGAGAVLGTCLLQLEGSVDAHAWMHVHGVGHMLALGFVTAAWAGAVRRLASGASVLGTAALSLVVGAAVVAPDLAGPASRMAARTGIGGWAAMGAIAVAIAVPAAEAAGRRIAGRFAGRPAALLFASGVGVVGHFVLPLRHPGLHLLAAWLGAAAVAGAFRGARRPSGGPWSHRALALAAGFAAFTVIVPPPPRAADLLARATGCVLFPWRARVSAMKEASWRPARPPTSPWFHDRKGAPPVPPTGLPSRPAAPVIVLLTIDALRADALHARAAAAATPELRELRDASVSFASARASSNRTIATLASMFSGVPVSGLRWSERDHPVAGTNVWPHTDPTPRLAHLLSRAGVQTINVASVDYLVDAYGVVAGFGEDRVVTATGRGVGPEREPPWASAQDVADGVVEALAQAAATERPVFVYAHMLDAHDPYDQGDPPPGTDERGRWLAEVATVDAQIGRIVDAIDDGGLRDRATVIVTADHGEAFGEHGATLHGTLLYDEILRVPLLVRGPGLAPRTVDIPVSLLDLGPTILDLFGAPTPGTWLGQTLVPMLGGDVAALERPLVFEARPKQGLLRPDGIKVIRDLRLGTVEAYDLTRDPLETENLFDGSEAAREELLGELATFFSAHEHREPGYETPVR